MKMAFLFEKDVADSMSVGVESLGFFPHHFGPYSKAVDDALSELEREGEIGITMEADFDRQRIELKSAGLRDSAEVLKRLTRGEFEQFAKKRKAWDQLGPKGLLQKVYEEYPAYSVKSKISDEVKRDARWK